MKVKYKSEYPTKPYYVVAIDRREESTKFAKGVRKLIFGCDNHLQAKDVSLNLQKIEGLVRINIIKTKPTPSPYRQWDARYYDKETMKLVYRPRLLEQHLDKLDF